MNTILVTGATGNIGRPLVMLLAAKGMNVRAVTRDPVRAALPAGVEAVESAIAGVAGSRAVFLNSRALQDDLGGTVEAAREAGVGRLVALSAINADDDFARQPSRVRGDRNKEVEELAVGSGLEWVSLRPTVFASNFAGMWGPQLRAGDVVGGPFAEASIAPIVDADIAAVAAAALLDDDLVGRRIPLTGPEALTNAELVETIGAVLGRALTTANCRPKRCDSGSWTSACPPSSPTPTWAFWARRCPNPRSLPTRWRRSWVALPPHSPAGRLITATCSPISKGVNRCRRAQPIRGHRGGSGG